MAPALVLSAGRCGPVPRGLLGAADEDEALTLLGRVPQAPRSAKLSAWLRALYPPDPASGEWLATLQPDRLAERHVVTELGSSETFAGQCLTGLNERQARRGVILLARASTENDIAERLLSRLLPLVSKILSDIQAPLEILISIANAIPYPSVTLAPAYAAITRRILDTLPPAAATAERCRWLTTHGVALGQMGRPADALPVTEEAVAIYRQLAAASPDRYRPYLATSLNNLGACFFELGRPADALRVTQESVAIRRELAAASPDRYRKLQSTYACTVEAASDALLRV